MDHSLIFGRHFSRLVWLLLHEPANVDEQKAALRALVTVSQDGPVILATREWQLVTDAGPLPNGLAGVQDLTAQMIGHAVRQLRTASPATPVDLLAAARILASEPVPGDGGRRALQRLRADDVTTVRFIVGADPRPWRMATTPVTPHHTIPSGEEGFPDDRRDMEFVRDLHLMSPEEAEAAYLAQFEMEPSLTPNQLPPSTTVAPTLDERMRAFQELIVAGDPDQLLAALDATTGMLAKAAQLEQIAALVERATREGAAMLAADLIGGIAAREVAAPEGSETRRMFGHAYRRLAKPPLLRQVAMLLPRKRPRVAEHELVLTRAGEEGAEALIDQLTQATTAEDRRTYYNLLLQVRAGVPALVHMLGDARWYVVRNAADLLGEMQAREAEQSLVRCLRHADERVRKAASNALVRLGTPAAMQAVQAAMRDDTPVVRQMAAQALALRKERGTAATLLRALDKEENEEVQLAIVAALGRIGTPDAVQRLVSVTEPGGRFFRRKSTAVRVAAVQGLGDARTPIAMACLAALTDDREKEVRDAAVRALGRRD